MGQKWNYQPPTTKQKEDAKRLSEELDMSPILCGLLLQRGIKTAAEARNFFRPKLSNLHDPFLMNDMDIAVERLNKALGRKERIMVYGDYDVDGTTAVALVYKFLQQFSLNIDYYIPDRNEDGYGISKRGIDYAHSTGVKLIIVLDCGIKAIEEIAYAKSLGIDFICWDAEDCGTPQFDANGNHESTWCLGSQYWSGKRHIDGYNARYGINLDMVGNGNSVFYCEGIIDHAAT